MNGQLLIVLLLLLFFAVYVAAKVYVNIRKSESQWRQVDKSKLKEWDDEDD
jgi:hypothetical protein